MASDKHAAEKKFWRTPELVENALLPFLDIESVEQLAKYDIIVKMLGKTFTWNTLVNVPNIPSGSKAPAPYTPLAVGLP